MSFERFCPATANSDALLPFGPSYAETQEPHDGCPGGGQLVADIDRFTGAMVDTCTACSHYRVISGIGAQDAAARLASAPRVCACGCRRPLTGRQMVYASAECQRRAFALEAAARLAAGISQPQRVNPQPVCKEPGCGISFPYRGNGRPPKYCPSHETSSTKGKRLRRERRRLAQAAAA